MPDTYTDPKIQIVNVSLAAGAFRKVEDLGLAVAFFFTPALTLGNSLFVRFGPTAAEMDLTGLNGVYIQLGAPVKEFTIRNAGAGPITGQVIMSPCGQFSVDGL